MARKRSRSSARYRRTRASQAQETPQERGSASQEVSFADEYRYVVKDLKRFAALAVAMLVILIVLALVLT